MLSRSQFDSAARSLAAQYDSEPSALPALRDWSWIDRYPYGYLSRSKRYLRKRRVVELDEVVGEEPELEEDVSQDSAIADGSVEVEEVISQQFVVYSASFQVPAFYFTVHTPNGVPLSLDELMDTSLFKFQVPDSSRANGYALTLPDAPFPLLSQGDHPTLGTPCWYLHPCETSTAVDELFTEVMGSAEWDEETRLVRWMETWFMTVCGVLDL